MRGCLKALAMFGMVAALAAPAMAQGRGGFGGGMMGGGMGGGVNLIGNESVQKELKLDEAQIKKSGEVSQDYRAKMQDARSSTEGLEGEARMKKMQELLKAGNDEAMLTLGTFLKPEQLKRFKEVSLQQRGAGALSDPSVTSALKVTDEQAAKVKTILGEAQAEMREIGQSAGDDHQAAMQKIQALRKEVNTKAMALMTGDQKKTWKEMTGEPFEVIYPQRPNQ